MKKRPTSRPRLEHTSSRFNMFSMLAFLLILVVIGALAVLAHARGSGPTAQAGAGIASGPTATVCPSEPEGTIYQNDYAVGATNLHDLKAQSTGGVVEATVLRFDHTIQASPNSPEVQSVYDLQVTQTIAQARVGPALPESSGVIQVRQAGGVIGCETYSVPGDPLLRPGEHDILFLMAWPGVSGYDIFDDTVGRFIVTPSGQIAPNNYTTVQVASGMSEAAFIAAIQAA